VKAQRPIVLLAALLALGVPLAAAGCGGDNETTVTETVGAQTSTQPDGGEAASDSTTAKRGPNYFQTPSQNIGCYISRHDARCDIRERSWSPPPEPDRCRKIGLDYGQGIVVGATRAEFICAGDTSLGGPATLPYGSDARRGSFRCHSGQKGVTCSNAANGHGFFLSRQSYRIF
jgi:hypothetical protein